MAKRNWTEAQRQHNNEYQRTYRRDHPDRVKEWRVRYYLRYADRLRAAQAEADAGGVGHEH